MSTENEEPHLSSAATCISLRHLGKTFGPVYTHQSFDDERIRGHQPFDDAIARTTRAAETLHSQRSSLSTHAQQEADDNGQPLARVPHKSFQHHETATHRIAVSVVLAPSCRTCAMTIQTELKKRPRAMSGSASDVSVSDSDVSSSRPSSPYVIRSPCAAKRRRLSRRRGESDEESCSSSPFSRMGSSSILERLESLDGGADPSGSAGRFGSPLPPSAVSGRMPLPTSSNTMVFHPLPSGKTRRRRMDIDEVMGRAVRALPPLVRCDHCLSSFGDCADNSASAVSSLVQLRSVDHVENDYLDAPIGTVLHEYQRPIKDITSGATIEMGDFVLCLADGKDPVATEYHNQVQNLALWFIENASNVDLSANEDGGYWKVLYVFRKHAAEKDHTDTHRDRVMPPSSPLLKRAVETFYSTSETLLSLFSRRLSPRSNLEEAIRGSNAPTRAESSASPEKNGSFRYSLVGYMTLHHFFSQYKKPTAGTVMRMCQVVVLPPYQRTGHGKVMMYGVHDIAGGMYDGILAPCAEQRGDIVEVDVEDPAIEFTSLRDRVDYEIIRDSIASDSRSLLGTNAIGSSVFHSDFYLPLAANDAIIASATAKISPSQIQIALELYKRQVLDEQIERLTGDKKKKLTAKRKSIAKLEAMFEVMVKKRLFKLHREDISGCGGKNEKEEVLAYLYTETLKHYRSVLGSRRR